MKRALALATLLALPGAAAAQLLVPRGTFVTDAAGAPRVAFTSTEQLALTQTVYLTAAANTPISFKFSILNPSGQQVFLQQGNSAPAGSAGEASARVSGIPISRFYTVPGQYTLVSEATVEAAPITQRTPFTITSPILTLLYPPDGVRGLEDHPLLFHWTGSGASRARVQVSDDGSFYRVLFGAETSDNSFAYPDNPSDNRQRLVGNQVYYWRVQGLDANGNMVAQSGTYSFSLKGSAVGGLTRDLAVTQLDVESNAPSEPGAIPFRVTIKNQGGTTETNASLRFTVGGIAPPGSPFRLPPLSAGEEYSRVIPAKVPSDQDRSLTVACLDLFDDSVLNNCKTLLVTTPKVKPPTPEEVEKAKDRAAETGDEERSHAAAAWDSMKAAADSEIKESLKGYHADEIAGEGMTAAESKQLLEDIKKGKAKILEMTVE